MIAARGTSDHAAIYAKYLLELRNRMVVSLAAPSAFSLYHQPPRVDQFCVIGISQSGASVDICSVVEEGRRQGAAHDRADQSARVAAGAGGGARAAAGSR